MRSGYYVEDDILQRFRYIFRLEFHPVKSDSFAQCRVLFVHANKVRIQGTASLGRIADAIAVNDIRTGAFNRGIGRRNNTDEGKLRKNQEEAAKYTAVKFARQKNLPLTRYPCQIASRLMSLTRWTPI